jgi:hypothetical protein
LTAPKVLIYAPNDCSKIEQSARAAGYEPSAVDPTAIVVTPEYLGDAPEAALARLPVAPVIVSAGPWSRALLAAVVAHPKVLAICPRGMEGHSLEVAHRGPRFGAACPPLVPVLSREIGASVERDALLQAVEQFLRDQGLRPRLVDHARDALEELITNAIYDAPTDEHGRRLYVETDRRSAIFLPEAARPRLDLAVDGPRVMAAMTDPHGSLDLQTARRFLAMGLRGELSDKPGGAGLGFARVLGLVHHLSVQIEPRVRTEIAFVLDTSASPRAQKLTSVLLAST